MGSGVTTGAGVGSGVGVGVGWGVGVGSGVGVVTGVGTGVGFFGVEAQEAIVQSKLRDIRTNAVVRIVFCILIVRTSQSVLINVPEVEEKI